MIDVWSTYDRGKPHTGGEMARRSAAAHEAHFRCRPFANVGGARSRVAVATWSNRTHNYRPTELVVCGYCIRHGYDRVLSETIYATRLVGEGSNTSTIAARG